MSGETQEDLQFGLRILAWLIARAAVKDALPADRTEAGDDRITDADAHPPTSEFTRPSERPSVGPSERQPPEKPSVIASELTTRGGRNRK